jgi:outer membrane protein assembly factor BamB
MRVPAIGATTYWGVVASMSLLLPVGAALAGQQSPQVPAPPTATPAFEVLWQAEVGIVKAPQLAAGASALFVADEGGVRALAADTGKALWSTEHGVSGVMAAGHGVVLVPTADALIVLDQQTGAERWQAAVEHPVAVATASGVFAAAGAVVQAWHMDGTPRWQRTLAAPLAAPIAVDGTAAATTVLVVMLSDKSISALAAADGTPRWQHPIPSLPRAITVSGDRLYFGGADGAVYAYGLDGSEDPAWRFDVRAVTIGAPAVDDRCAYVALIDNSVRAFKRGSGNLCWLTPLDMRPAAGPAIVGEDLAVLTATGTLVALEKATGRPIGAPVTAPGAAPESRPRLLAATTDADGTIYALTVSTGTGPMVTAFRRTR